MHTLVIDIATDRIVYFTDDPVADLFTDEYSALATYDGVLPEELTNKNCWGFIYRNKKIISPPKQAANGVKTLEQNKEWLRDYLKKKIDSIHTDLTKPTLMGTLKSYGACEYGMSAEAIKSYLGVPPYKDLQRALDEHCESIRLQSLNAMMSVLATANELAKRIELATDADVIPIERSIAAISVKIEGR